MGQRGNPLCAVFDIEDLLKVANGPRFNDDIIVRDGLVVRCEEQEEEEVLFKVVDDDKGTVIDEVPFFENRILVGCREVVDWLTPAGTLLVLLVTVVYIVT